MSLPTDTLYFYSQSADKAPGKGANESVANPAAYRKLAQRPGWRRVLSNFHVCPFLFEGAHYRTVEHAFQAAKIRLADPQAARAFTVESGTELGVRGDGLDARKQRKMVRLDPRQLAAWNAMSARVMARAQAAKFAQCEGAREVLLDTQQAQLWHVMPRAKPVRFADLERVRDRLRGLERRLQT